jgi:hypothetical protein
MATTTTNFGWDIPQSTDLVKDGATAIAALGQDIDIALVDLKGGTTGQVLSKASGTDLDFTWVAQDDSSAIQNAIVDAKGDLISATAADTPARLAVGTNGQVLTADSTTATGLKWATASGGGVTLIQDTVASGNTAIDFSSISGSYKHLFLTWHGLYTNADGSFFSIRVNSDSGSNYVRQYFYYEDDSPFTSPAFTVGDSSSTNFDAFVNQGSNTTASKTAFGYINIYDYASTTRTKKFESDYFYWSNNNSRYNRLTQQGYWNSTSAITSVNIYRGNGTATLSNLTNTSIQLWGVS